MNFSSPAIRIIGLLIGLVITPQLWSQTTWLRRASSTNLDEATDIAYDAISGGTIATGAFSATCNFSIQSLTSSGFTDVFVAKYSSAGDPQWVKKCGGSGIDRAQAIDTDEQGNAYITGFFNGTATFGTFTVTAADSGDVFVAKLNVFGDVLWVATAGGTYNDNAFGVSVGSNGKVAVTGTFRGQSNFGSISLTSTTSTLTNQPSADIFVAQLSNKGTWEWVKQGIASYDDRGMDVVIDDNGNVYATCQFSDDITFDSFHDNQALNAGCLVKFDSSGNEVWFARLLAGQILPNAIDIDSQQNIYVAGESIGQLFVFATNSINLAPGYTYSAFLMKFSPSGSITWIEEEGSDNVLSARAIDISENDEVFVAGTFNCSLSEYAAELGEGRFYSVGYRDVFITRFDTSGDRLWMAQYGGPRDDFCSGVCPSNVSDDPVITGSFEKFFNIPTDDTYFNNSTLWSPPSNQTFEYPNTEGPYCDEGYSGNFLTVSALGGKDIFITMPYDPEVAPYDFFSRDGACDYGIVEPCIGDINMALQCPDSLALCGVATLYYNLNSGTNCFIGPEYEWEWSTGSNANFITTGNEGWYTVETERMDGCDAFVDSVNLDLLPIPEPWITDDAGVNTNAPPNATQITVCYPETVQLTGGNLPGINDFWTLANGTITTNTVIIADTSGQYVLSSTNEYGCSTTNTVAVSIIEPLDTIQPVLQFSDGVNVVNDTITLCAGDLVNFEVTDILDQVPFEEHTDVIWQLFQNGTFVTELDDNTTYSFQPQAEDWYTVTAEPYYFIPDPCTIDTTYYPIQELTFYVNVLPTPSFNIQILGPTQFCPGDTLLLIASGSPNYTWFGPGIAQVVGSDSAYVTQPGNYSVQGYEVFENGCDLLDTDAHFIQAIPAPVITSFPNYAVVCPNDSLLLSCQSGDAYQWVGPGGVLLGSTQEIYVGTPGIYYCIQTENNCTQESNELELLEYTTPYLLTYPSSDLCLTGFVNIQVQTLPGAVIEWQTPLSGSNPGQTVFNAGTYTVEVTSCDIVSEVSVLVTNSAPIAVIQSSDDVICPGQTVTLSANPGMDEYNWSPGGSNTSTLIVSQAGTYSVSVVDTLGCESESVSFTIAAYPLNAPIVQNNPVCYGGNANAFANGTSTFFAADILGNTVLSTGSLYTINNLTEPITIYAFSEDEQCTSLPTPVVFGIYPSSTAEIIANDSTFCISEIIELSTPLITSPGITYVWSHPNNTLTSGNTITIPSGNAQNGWFTLTVTDVFCSSSDSIFIIVEDSLKTSIIPDDVVKVCIGSELLLDASNVNGPYTWETPNGVFTTSTLEISETDEGDNGTYALTVPGVYCATQTDITEVEIVPYPDYDLTPADAYCDAGYMTAHIEEGYDHYVWSNGDTDNEAIIPLNGILFVDVINDPGCIRSDSVYVSEIDCISTFPNVFTPNNNSQNEYIDFGWLRIPIDRVLIYNRWGMLVREMNSPEWVWDGNTDAGNPVPDGVYYYIVESPKPGKHFHQISGYIHIFRVRE